MAGPPTQADIELYRKETFDDLFSKLRKKSVGSRDTAVKTIRRGGVTLRVECQGRVFAPGEAQGSYVHHDRQGIHGIVRGYSNWSTH